MKTPEGEKTAMGNAAVVLDALNRRFLSERSVQAAHQLETMTPGEAAPQLITA